MQKILILGADGFIGSALVKSLLLENKHDIVAFDLFKDGCSKNLEDVKGKIKFFSGNFLNKDDVNRALDGVDFVFHFVSMTTPGSSYNDPMMDVETNIHGTINLLEKCVEKGIKKIVFSSSGGAIYGNQDKDVLSESDPVYPISPYAISKLTIENYLEFYRVKYGLEYLILRYANPYGPGQNILGSQGIIPIFLNLIKNGEPLSVFGDGENERDYIYIDDLIENTKRIFQIKTKHRVYNIGSGTGKTINEIINTIVQCCGKKVDVKRLPARTIDVRRSVLDTARIKSEIECASNVPLDQGIKSTWDWINK